MTSRYEQAAADPNITPRSRWLVLAVLCCAQLLTVLNFQTVTVALPTIQRELALPESIVQWVVSANELAFGGLLLLAGRLTDLFGQRRSFLAGMALLTVASLACGLARTGATLIAARALQGAATALVTPAALALLSSSFPEPAERLRALGIWGAFGPIGGIIGLVAGGLLASYGWPWIFAINIPIGLLALIAGPWLLPQGAPSSVKGRLDIAGTLVGTGGLMALVYGLTLVQRDGLAQPFTLIMLALAIGLLGAFWLIEWRARDPLVPGRLVRRRLILGANIVTLLHAATTNTPIILFALYMQQVQGVSAFMTGLAFLPTNLAIVGGAAVSTALAARLGYGRTAAIGMGIVAVALLLLTRLQVQSDYVVDLLPGLVLVGLGLGITSVIVNAAGTHGVAPADHGIAWGLVNSSARIGTALGLAILLGVASAHTSVPGQAAALVEGFRWAYGVALALALLAVALSLVLLRGGGLGEVLGDNA